MDREVRIPFSDVDRKGTTQIYDFGGKSSSRDVLWKGIEFKIQCDELYVFWFMRYLDLCRAIQFRYLCNINFCCICFAHASTLTQSFTYIDNLNRMSKFTVHHQHHGKILKILNGRDGRCFEAEPCFKNQWIISEPKTAMIFQIPPSSLEEYVNLDHFVARGFLENNMTAQIR